jgi:hypothetical protein
MIPFPIKPEQPLCSFGLQMPEVALMASVSIQSVLKP